MDSLDYLEQNSQSSASFSNHNNSGDEEKLRFEKLMVIKKGMYGTSDLEGIQEE
eukprot:CAMPEP_0170563278 /NCGR_PEP_ID=MMETSP0211-20121228/65531_1 /TAXON_ID=311385 /ORGANISM="Pseudokeronopsis sp., Strain OXSARD2" /LENGTH=53 /DNA_ID=CAMNT_0010881321 /DNA_START=71 /DNA_END=232 /DNA_ORIENTATION=-